MTLLIQRLRQHRQLSRANVAKRCRISPTSYRLLEKGLSQPRLDTVSRLERFFGAPARDLFAESSNAKVLFEGRQFE